jgi:hypothetical protein
MIGKEGLAASGNPEDGGMEEDEIVKSSVDRKRGIRNSANVDQVIFENRLDSLIA